MIPPAILKISPSSQSTSNIPAIVHNISNSPFPVVFLVKVYPFVHSIKQGTHHLPLIKIIDNFMVVV